MRVIVADDTDFIGIIAEQLTASSHDITILDKFVSYYDLGIKDHDIEAIREVAAANGGSCRLVRDTLTIAELVEDLVAETDIVYHQAAQAGIRKSVEEPAKDNRYNVAGIINVLEASRKYDIDRVVVASSSSVYEKPEYLPYDEDHPTTPVSPYGVSKLAAEQYARVYSEIYCRIEKPDNTI